MMLLGLPEGHMHRHRASLAIRPAPISRELPVVGARCHKQQLLDLFLELSQGAWQQLQSYTPI